MKKTYTYTTSNRAVLSGLGVIMLLLIGGVFFLEAWVAMLIIGGLHSAIPGLPAFGYGITLLLILALNFVGAFFKRSTA